MNLQQTSALNLAFQNQDDVDELINEAILEGKDYYQPHEVTETDLLEDAVDLGFVEESLNYQELDLYQITNKVERGLILV